MIVELANDLTVEAVIPFSSYMRSHG